MNVDGTRNQNQNQNQDSQVVPITSMVAKFGNLENFREAWENAGYVIIDLPYVTWYYAAQLINGQKQVIRKQQLVDFVVPTR